LPSIATGLPLKVAEALEATMEFLSTKVADVAFDYDRTAFDGG
jgi:hypothetical protein